MNLEEFISKAIKSIMNAVDEADKVSEKHVYLNNGKTARTVEFDIAVAVENSDSNQGKGGIKVLEFIEGGVKVDKETKNSTITRIKFGIEVSRNTKEEINNNHNFQTT